MQDSKIYVEQHFLESQGEINYHNWFLYEQFMTLLKEANGQILNPEWLERFLQHPFNILQYYQPPQSGPSLTIPEPLITQFQQFGSLHQNPYEMEAVQK